MQTRQQKEEIVKDLVLKIKNSKAVVLSDFKGLNVQDMTVLRSELRKKNIDFKVLKKTLITIALKDAGIEMDVTKMKGQIAVAVSAEDEIEASRIIAKMTKVNENLKIAGGILGNKVLSQKEVLALSKLSSKGELLSKLVRVFNAPISGFTNIFAGNIRGLVQVFKAIEEKKV